MLRILSLRIALRSPPVTLSLSFSLSFLGVTLSALSGRVLTVAASTPLGTFIKKWFSFLLFFWSNFRISCLLEFTLNNIFIFIIFTIRIDIIKILAAMPTAECLFYSECKTVPSIDGLQKHSNDQLNLRI